MTDDLNVLYYWNPGRLRESFLYIICTVVKGRIDKYSRLGFILFNQDFLASIEWKKLSLSRYVWYANPGQT